MYLRRFNIVKQGVFKENLKLHKESSDAVLKYSILIADGNELPAFDEKDR